jgi:hypothetical protein
MYYYNTGTLINILCGSSNICERPTAIEKCLRSIQEVNLRSSHPSLQMLNRGGEVLPQ